MSSPDATDGKTKELKMSRMDEITERYRRIGMLSSKPWITDLGWETKEDYGNKFIHQLMFCVRAHEPRPGSAELEPLSCLLCTIFIFVNKSNKWMIRAIKRAGDGYGVKEMTKELDWGTEFLAIVEFLRKDCGLRIEQVSEVARIALTAFDQLLVLAEIAKDIEESQNRTAALVSRRSALLGGEVAGKVL